MMEMYFSFATLDKCRVSLQDTVLSYELSEMWPSFSFLIVLKFSQCFKIVQNDRIEKDAMCFILQNRFES